MASVYRRSIILRKAEKLGEDIDEVEMILEEEQIVLRPITTPRKGWDEAFRQMHENGDDQPLMDDFFEDENFEEWK